MKRTLLVLIAVFSNLPWAVAKDGCKLAVGNRERGQVSSPSIEVLKSKGYDFVKPRSADIILTVTHPGAGYITFHKGSRYVGPDGGEFLTDYLKDGERYVSYDPIESINGRPTFLATLTNRSDGFRKSVDLDLVHPVPAETDLRRIKFKLAVLNASTHAEYLEAKRKLETTDFHDTPAKTAYDSAIELLVTCDEFLNGT